MSIRFNRSGQRRCGCTLPSAPTIRQLNFGMRPDIRKCQRSHKELPFAIATTASYTFCTNKRTVKPGDPHVASQCNMHAFSAMQCDADPCDACLHSTAALHQLAREMHFGFTACHLFDHAEEQCLT
jgi:hypothetical protein